MSKLKLEVVLAAVDKLTRPLKQAMAGNKELARAVKQSRDQLKALDKTQEQIGSFASFKRKVLESTKALEDNQKQVNTLARQMKEAEAIGNPTIARHQEAKAALENMKALHKEASKQISAEKALLAVRNGEHAYTVNRIKALRIEAERDPSGTIAKQRNALIAEQHRRLENIHEIEKKIGSLQNQKRTSGLQIKQDMRGMDALKKAAEAAEKPIKELSKEFEEAIKTSKSLKTQHGKETEQLEQMRRGLMAAGIQSTGFASAQAKLKGQISQATAALEKQQAALERANQRQQRLIAAQERYTKTMATRDKVAGAGGKMLAGGAVIGATMAAPVMAFAQAEDSATQLKGAMMRAGGVVPPEFEQINRLAEKLGDRLPGTTSDFQDMMTMLQRQGMSAKAVLGGLGEATAYLGVQLKMTPEAAAEFTAKLQDATRTSEKDMMGLVDMIQRGFYAGVDSTNMLEAYKGLGAAMDMVKVKGLEGAKAFAPFVVMMDQAGMRGESAGNAIRKVIAASLNVDKIKKVQKALRKEKGIALDLDFTNDKGEFGGLDKMMARLSQLKKLDTVNRIAVLQDIFGTDKETSEVISKIIEKGKGGYDDVVQNLAEQASLQERVNLQLGTLKNLWDAASGTFTNAMVKFGEAIAPETKAAVEWIGQLSERLSGWAKANPELANTLMRVTAFTGIALLAVGGLALAIAALLGPLALAHLSLSTLGIRAGGLAARFGGLGGAAGKTGHAMKAGWATAAKAAKGAGQVIATAWSNSNPREPLKRLWEMTKGLKTTLPAAMRASISKSRELASNVSNKFKAGKLAVYKYTAALWRAVAAQLALARASAGSKLGAVTQYIKTRGVKGMAMDGLKGGGKLIGGGLAAAASGAVSAVMGIGQALIFVGRLAMANPIGLVIGLAALLIYKYWEPIKAWFSGFWEGLKEGLAPLGAIFDQVFAAIGPALEPLRPVWDWLVGAFKTAWEWVSKLLGPVDASKESLDKAAGAGKGFGKMLAGLIVIGAELAAKFVTVGLDIMSGIVSGIKKGIVWVKDAILGVGELLPEWLRKKLDIHSPSRVFATIGGYTMAGLEQGIDKGQAGPLAAVQSAAKKITAAGAGMVLATAPAMAGQLDTRPPLRAHAPAVAAPASFNITIHAAPGMNEQQLAALVQRQVAQALANAQNQQAARQRSRLGDFD
ncbi:phage tail tape measure protein [Chromobacterium sphagni]|uniref:Phage tail tape measure protein n=1 Tax=Chromobacterium sphagni TaxID=1903179 RepID=A0ABX3CC22_9NEIS|nr:phage tail tape measure protein [Chromobacterium sphagni]OHX19852.1 phage tail tape measure protein [Chromobacterium sphagni]